MNSTQLIGPLSVHWAEAMKETSQSLKRNQQDRNRARMSNMEGSVGRDIGAKDRNPEPRGGGKRSRRDAPIFFSCSRLSIVLRNAYKNLTSGLVKGQATVAHIFSSLFLCVLSYLANQYLTSILLLL